MPPVVNGKATAKKTIRSRAGLQNSVIELVSSSTESSDAESTQHGPSVKPERVEGSTGMRAG
ncbi:hypothetical protein P3T76_000904 [Phytophthora citrophthora]|uniref:Uncharacterized protein n=1 Tax=Phytophthora citrophthora TaxID=4793 RepID=A0AAD9GYF8_9STRA|nr:hypothetical protein P3T76_000904 [Phytophthora citrophthora]